MVNEYITLYRGKRGRCSYITDDRKLFKFGGKL